MDCTNSCMHGIHVVYKSVIQFCKTKRVVETFSEYIYKYQCSFSLFAFSTVFQMCNKKQLSRGAGAGPAAPLPKQCASPEIHCRPAIVWHSILYIKRSHVTRYISRY
jgi:hypothetical protein